MISILQQPQAYTPAYNDNVWVVTSDKKTQANFRYIADVIVNGQSFRQAVFPHPTYSTGVFNVGRIVENYITNTLSKDNQFKECVGSIINYSVQFGEEFGLSSSGTTIYPNQVSSSKYVWNGIVDYLPYANYNYTTYVSKKLGSFLETLRKADFLTNAPSSGVIRSDEDAWLTAMTENADTFTYANINTYDISNNLIQNVKVINDYRAVSGTNSMMVRFGSGTNNLNDIPSSGVITGSQPIITDSVSKYSISFETDANYIKTNTYWYLIDNTCTKYDTFRFHFLNKVGGWDSFTFIRASVRRAEINRSTYKKRSSDMLTSTTYGYSAKDSNMIDYDIKMREIYRVQSDWIKEDTYEWLYELFTSPQVYVDDATYGLVAVNILNSAYDFKQDVRDKLFNIEIEFRYSFDNYRQRR